MGLKSKEQAGGGRFISIIGDTFREKVEEGTDGAIKREYKDRDGNPKIKWEKHHGSLEAMLTSIEFKDGNFGEQAIVTLTDVDEVYTLFLSTDDDYFTSLAKILPNIDLSQEVELEPYDYIKKKTGKPKRGIGVMQGGVKLFSYYWDNDNKKNVHGLPQSDKNSSKEGHADKYDSDDWTLYWLKVKKFLKGTIKDMDFSATSGVKPMKVSDKDIDLEPDDNDDLPF